MKKMPINRVINFHPELKNEDQNSILERKSINVDLAQEEDGTIVVIASTPDVDHDFDIIHPLGIKTDKYTGTVCFNHDLSILPIGKCIEHNITDKGMIAKLSLSTTYDFAIDCYNLIKEKILTGISVGYIPKKVLMAGTKSFNDFAKLHGYITTGVKRILAEVELIEISLVPVACNESALVLASKSFTSEYSKKAFKIEDDTEVLTDTEVPEASLEQIVNENNIVEVNEDNLGALNDKPINTEDNITITESTDQIISNESTSDNITMDKEVIIEKPIEEIIQKEIIKTEEVLSDEIKPEIIETEILTDKVCKPKKSFTIIRIGKKAITPEIMIKSLKIVQGK